MQEISQDTLNEAAKLAQSARITLWEIDLTQSGGDRYFFCNEANEKGEAVTWQGRKYDVYPVDGCGFEMNGKGAAARPSLKVSGMYMTGASMILGGVAQMLAPKPKMSEMRQTDNGRQNTYFSSLDNMVANGNTLPVLYGEMQVGSRVISQEISTADEGDGGQVVVIGR